MGVLLAWSDVTTAFPNDTALASLPVGTQNDIIADIQYEVNANAFSNSGRAKSAAKYLAAHMGTIAARNIGGNAPVTQVTVGQVSKMFATSMAQGVSVLESTIYGREYQRRVRASAYARISDPADDSGFDPSDF